MMLNLMGNPHSTSSSSQYSTLRIEEIRLQALRFFNASPNDFDLIFVANATAGIKLVAEGFRDNAGGFWYGYHKDAHTSLVGVREVATTGHHCFESDTEVEAWLKSSGTANTAKSQDYLGLFAYPAQSNFNGRRLPLSWLESIRSSSLSRFRRRGLYTLLDAAALASTSPLDLSNASLAPDFTVLSFYKIFGFPDLGAVIVRKGSEGPLQRRKYFGGGTVQLVTCLKEQWHIKKASTLHEPFEDGTLPIHSIIALGCALNAHGRMYGSIERVSFHTSFLAKDLYEKLSSLRHWNGLQVCKIHKDPSSSYADSKTQGPVIALSLRNCAGEWTSNYEVEKLAFVKSIQFRSGGLCNPGGIASALGLAPWEFKRNFSAGARCGNDNDIIGGKSTGVIRVSLGAMSDAQDVKTFVDFIAEFFVETQPNPARSVALSMPTPAKYFIEELTVYPIKSCGGWSVPSTVLWDIRPEGLAWDREWCLVQGGTRAALSQKKHPQMALLKPFIDLENGLLRIQQNRLVGPPSQNTEITVPLSADPSQFEDTVGQPTSRVCNDKIIPQVYSSSEIATFFTKAIGTPCTLARFPPNTAGDLKRYCTASLQPHQQAGSSENDHRTSSAATAGSTVASRSPTTPRPILLANESPILTISQSSINQLNEDIQANCPGKTVEASAFRANILVAEDATSVQRTQQPYVEDSWRKMHVISRSGHTPAMPKITSFDLLGACRRCQMVCVDQHTGERGQEPFVTLAKTRRFGGKVFFGVHTALSNATGARIAVGDQVIPVKHGEESELEGFGR